MQFERGVVLREQVTVAKNGGVLLYIYSVGNTEFNIDKCKHSGNLEGISFKMVGWP